VLADDTATRIRCADMLAQAEHGTGTSGSGWWTTSSKLLKGSEGNRAATSQAGAAGTHSSKSSTGRLAYPVKMLAEGVAHRNQLAPEIAR